MGFLISSILQNKYELSLSGAEYATDENAFTILVGENATGKSRLLRRIVSSFIDPSGTYAETFPDRSVPGFHNDVLLAFDSRVVPSAVIAVATGRHDRFPPHESSSEGIKYSYVSSPEMVGGSLSESLREIFRKSLYHTSEMAMLGEVLVRLNFAPIISFRITTTPKAKNIARRLIEAKGTLFGTRVIDFFKSDGIENEFVLDSASELLALQKQEKLNVEINFDAGSVLVNSKGRNEVIFEMLDRGLLEIDGLTLIERKSKQRRQYGMLSSGQRCILSMLLGIAGSIGDESLICIDEPEISLHPRWQEEVIELLQVCFSGYKGCHFFIATHSPQVVSGLVSGLGFVLDMETRTLLSRDNYSYRSADFQLANVFHAPGRANEYMIRQCLVLLSKLKERKDFDDDDRKRLNWLEASKRNLGNDDPVYHLIEQLESLVF